MFECGKATLRRLHDARYATRYLVGHGLDIGPGNDPLWQYQPQFPCMTACDVWDKVHGDALFMAGVPDDRYDFVHSSHCLEHLSDPFVGLTHWFRILKLGGYLLVTVPDEDLYEQGVWPSTWNPEHTHTFTLWKPTSWSPVSVNVVDLIRHLGARCEPVSLLRLDATFRPTTQREDQTLTITGECAIECVIRKRP